MPRISISYTEQEVADFLNSKGYFAIINHERDRDCDGDVQISEGLSIQVGEGYLILQDWINTRAVKTIKEASTLEEIYKALKEYEGK